MPDETPSIIIHGDPNPLPPEYARLPWLVWLRGVRSPGPHAAFATEAEAKRHVWINSVGMGGWVFPFGSEYRFDEDTLISGGGVRQTSSKIL